MHRLAVRSAFGRGRLQLSRSRYPVQSSLRLFSATQCQRGDQGSGDQNPSRPKRSPSQPPSLRERSKAAASQLGNIKPAQQKAGGVDARALRATAPGAAAVSAKVINLRSLRGAGRAPGGPPGSGGSGYRPQRAGGPGDFNKSREGFKGGPRGPRGDGPRFGSRPGGRPGGRTGGQAGGRPKRMVRRKRFDGKGGPAQQEKLVWTPEEQTLVNQMEQGVVTPYTPEVSLSSLSGWGPAIAAKSAQSQIERALQSMRILDNARPFDDSIVYDDPRRRLRKYAQDKKPIFFDTLRQKQWLEAQNDGADLQPAKEATRKAIIDATILGKYESHLPEAAGAGKEDAVGMAARYHAKELSYRTKEREAFDAKLRSLLPGGKAPAPPAKKATA